MMWAIYPKIYNGDTPRCPKNLSPIKNADVQRTTDDAKKSVKPQETPATEAAENESEDSKVEVVENPL
jgi:hypothetical protein